jgi:hypothetical protein
MVITFRVEIGRSLARIAISTMRTLHNNVGLKATLRR